MGMVPLDTLYNDDTVSQLPKTATVDADICFVLDCMILETSDECLLAIAFLSI